MKKVFCGVCGDEMNYAEIPDYLRDRSTVVHVKGCETVLDFEVQVIIKPVYKTPYGGQKSDSARHIDICSGCRLHLLDRLDTRERPTAA